MISLSFSEQPSHLSSATSETPSSPVTFEDALTRFFPGAIPSEEFVQRSLEALDPFGFRSTNTLACFSVCRDELTRPFINQLHANWTGLFNCSGLAGMLYLGVTGFQTAQHHAPNDDGTERYVYYAFPHIGIDEEGIPGNCHRRGRHETSRACGALASIQENLTQGTLNLELNQDDLEHSLLKQRLFRKLKYGQVPDLIALTKLTQTVIQEDLERMIGLSMDQFRTPYAVFTGIQIHGPGEKTWIWSTSSYVVYGGLLEELKV